MSMFYDIDNTPIPGGVVEWAQLFEHANRQIARTWLFFHSVRISTVWLGLDHDFGWMATHGEEPNPNPVQFETMVFMFGWHGIYQERYISRELARRGHWRIVRDVIFRPVRYWRLYREDKKEYGSEK